MRNAQRANAEPLLEHYASLANEAAGAVIEAAKVSVRAFDAHRWAAGAVDIVKSRRALEDAMSSQAAALNHYQALAREAGAVQAAGGVS